MLGSSGLGYWFVGWLFGVAFLFVWCGLVGWLVGLNLENCQDALI